MIAAESSIPDMAKFLWPPTAELLSDQVPELQVLALSGLRDWLTAVESVPAFKVIMDDPFAFGMFVDEFIKSYVKTYKESND